MKFTTAVPFHICIKFILLSFRFLQTKSTSNKRRRMQLVLILAGLVLAHVAAEEPKCKCGYARNPNNNIVTQCVIYRGPPKGYKCVCSSVAWMCKGWTKACDPSENCPANCTSYECCKRGGGNCYGYSANTGI